MAEALRKKSPRAPSMALSEALDRALKVYDKERLHPAPIEVVANDIGYKNANSGAALSALASLRYFGLLERPKNGFLAVSKDVESFRFAPNEGQRQALLIQFLKQPALYAELLEKYASNLPSDASLKYELIQRGFIPAAADSTLVAFKQSMEFAGYYDLQNVVVDSAEDENASSFLLLSNLDEQVPLSATLPATSMVSAITAPSIEEDDLDRIPVRLPGGRRAWLLIPAPFYSADKNRLKAQIDLLLADDENGNDL